MMSKLSTAINLIKNDKAGFLAALLENVNFLFPDKLYLQLLFRCKNGVRLNLDNPKTFCEKIQWLKLYDRNPLYTNFVDKYAVKDYVAKKIGNGYIVPTLGVWESACEIDFDKLPNQFVLKTTNGGGGNVIICKDKSCFDRDSAIKNLKRSMKINIYNNLREWPYKNISSRIIVEKYMEDECGELNDYKFFCFGGEPQYCQVIRNRFVKETIDFYDTEWNHMSFVGLNPIVENGLTPVAKPCCLASMLDACKKLSKDIPFVRIDFYVIKNTFYFGEMTFYPASGFGMFRPKEWNYRFGDLINLPRKDC